MQQEIWFLPTLLLFTSLPAPTDQLCCPSVTSPHATPSACPSPYCLENSRKFFKKYLSCPFLSESWAPHHADSSQCAITLCCHRLSYWQGPSLLLSFLSSPFQELHRGPLHSCEPMLRRAPHLAQCSTIIALKFFISEEEPPLPHFYFALGPIHSIPAPGCLEEVRSAQGQLHWFFHENLLSLYSL